MFTTIVLKYGTAFMNLLTLSIVVTHFVIGVLLQVINKNRSVKMILMIVRGIYYVLAAITTFVIIGEGVKVYAWVGSITLLLALVYAAIRFSINEWRAANFKRASPRRANTYNHRSLTLTNSQSHPQVPTRQSD